VRESFRDVESLLNEVKPFLIRSGIQERACSMPTGVIESIDGHKYIEAFDCLYDLMKSPEWEKVQEKWSLCTPAVWANYDLMGITDLHEQRLLNAALLDFKGLWRKLKPSGFFGKHIDEPVLEETETPNQDSPEANPEAAGIQSSGAGAFEVSHGSGEPGILPYKVSGTSTGCREVARGVA
jgi:hypothetical protein